MSDKYTYLFMLLNFRVYCKVKSDNHQDSGSSCDWCKDFYELRYLYLLQLNFWLHCQNKTDVKLLVLI